jgi:hypothetical protein
MEKTKQRPKSSCSTVAPSDGMVLSPVVTSVSAATTATSRPPTVSNRCFTRICTGDMKRLILLIVSASLASCGGFDAFKRHDHLSSVVRRSYSNQELVLADYFFCAHQSKIDIALPNFEKMEFGADSLMGLFQTGLSNQCIMLRLDEGQNRATPLLCERGFITLKQMKKRFLSEADLGGQGTRYLVPVVNFADRYGFTAYVTSGGMGGHSGYLRYTSLSLLLFVVENGEIIYAENRRYASKRSWANTLEEVKAIPPAIEVRKEHIDELVRRGMRRYVRRLEK